MIRILSLGAGVQSSTLALLAEHGEIEKPDYAIFADTGWEPQHCYDWLNWLEKQLSYPVLRVSKGNIRNDLLANRTGTAKRFSSIPFFMDNAMGRRQCTTEYKVQPIIKKCRELLGYEPRKRIPAGSIEMLIGISRDEAQRMKPARDKWIENKWPLIELGMTRGDCLQWMNRNGYPQPPKSSCIGCPYHSNAHWIEMKQKQPDEWAEACFVDAMLRSGGTRQKMQKLEYMHRSLKPLAVAPLGDEYTADMFGNECEGMCGV